MKSLLENLVEYNKKCMFKKKDTTFLRKTNTIKKEVSQDERTDNESLVRSKNYESSIPS